MRCSQVAAWPRCQGQKFLERDPELARGEESETRRARYASSERRAAGRSFYTEAVAEWTCKQEIMQKTRSSRQSPSTVPMEDETDIANFIVTPDLRRERMTVVRSKFLLTEGGCKIRMA